MTPETYLVFLGVPAAFFFMPPGTGQLQIMSGAMRDGLRRSFATMTDDLAGNLVLMSAAVFGLAVLFATSTAALWIVIWLSVPYLACLGLKLMFACLAEPRSTPARQLSGTLFRKGFHSSSASSYALPFCGSRDLAKEVR